MLHNAVAGLKHAVAKHIKRYVTRRNIIILAVVGLIAWLVIRRQMQPVETTILAEGNRADVPTMTTYDSNIIHTDSGYPRYHATAQVYYSFDNAPEPFWRFDKGAFIEQYDNDRNVVATLQCDSAVYLQRPQIWDCIGNVRINNINGDKFLTNRMFYDVRAQKIYSDSFIHIEKSDRIIEGYGFRSNSAITDYEVHRPTMILPVSDFNRPPVDSTAAPASPQPTASAQASITAKPSPAPQRQKIKSKPATHNALDAPDIRPTR